MYVIGPDSDKKDGVYTGYFIGYTGDGKYSVKVIVSNNGEDARVVSVGASGAAITVNGNYLYKLP